MVLRQQPVSSTGNNTQRFYKSNVVTLDSSADTIFIDSNTAYINLVGNFTNVNLSDNQTIETTVIFPTSTTLTSVPVTGKFQVYLIVRRLGVYIVYLKSLSV